MRELPSFPLLKLPRLVLQYVIPHFELMNVIYLSFCNRAFRRLLQNYKYPICTIYWKIKSRDPKSWWVEITPTFIKDIYLRLAKSTENIEETMVRSKLNDVPLWLRIERSYYSGFEFITENHYQFWQNLAAHLYSIFKVKTVSCVSLVDYNDLTNSFIWNNSRKINNFFLTANHSLLELLNITEHLGLDSISVPGLRMEVKHLEYKELSKKYDISIEKYIKSKQRHVFVKSPYITTEEIIDLVKNWLEGRNDRFDSYNIILVARKWEDEHMHRGFDLEFFYQKVDPFINTSRSYSGIHPNIKNNPEVKGIRRKDGKGAMFHMGLKNFEFLVEME